MAAQRISPDEVRRRLDRGEQITFLDTRNPQAWGVSDVKVAGALRVPLDELNQHVGNLPRDRAIVTYCT